MVITNEEIMYSSKEAEEIANKAIRIFKSKKLISSFDGPISQVIHVITSTNDMDTYDKKFNEMVELINAVYTDKSFIIDPIKYTDYIFANSNITRYTDGIKLYKKLIDLSNIVILDNRWLLDHNLVLMVPNNKNCYNYDYLIRCLKTKLLLNYVSDSEKEYIKTLLKKYGED